jgi:hypothetical protein
MGQYYRGCILADNKKTVKAWMYSHSYNNGLKLMEHSWIKNNFVRAFETLILSNPKRVVWGGDYAEPDNGLKTNTYQRCKDELEVKPTVPKTTGNYIVNHSQKMFVNKKNVVKATDGWQIHPLPLLTCEGCGNGGGDFFGEDPKNLIGSWARDIISIEKVKPKGYTELIFDLVE